jgi:hypothetical protein
MRWSGPMAAMALLAIFSFSTATLATDDKDHQFGGPSSQMNVDERPFGGPPPLRRLRSPTKDRKTCKTAAGACELEKARPVGSDCSCVGGTSSGAKGKVE